MTILQTVKYSGLYRQINRDISIQQVITGF